MCMCDMPVIVHALNLKVREQFLGVNSFLQLQILETEFKLPHLHGKHSHLLSHLAGLGEYFSGFFETWAYYENLAGQNLLCRLGWP